MKVLLAGGAALCALALFATPMLAQKEEGLTLGRLSNGATVRFIKDASGTWGVDLSGPGAPDLSQKQPARFEIYTGAMPGPADDSDVKTVAGGYRSIIRSSGGVTATADVVSGNGATFHVEDRWSVKGAVRTCTATSR